MTRKPEIQILGVHMLPVTVTLVERQMKLLYGHTTSDELNSKARKQCRSQLSSVALIETAIKRPDLEFSPNHFTQSQPGIPRDRWQAPYLLRYLNADGTAMIECEDGDVPDRDHYRCVFYLHYYQNGKPLITSYGERFCPPLSSTPDRLLNLAPFEPVD